MSIRLGFFGGLAAIVRNIFGAESAMVTGAMDNLQESMLSIVDRTPSKAEVDTAERGLAPYRDKDGNIGAAAADSFFPFPHAEEVGRLLADDTAFPEITVFEKVADGAPPPWGEALNFTDCDDVAVSFMVAARVTNPVAKSSALATANSAHAVARQRNIGRMTVLKAEIVKAANLWVANFETEKAELIKVAQQNAAQSQLQRAGRTASLAALGRTDLEAQLSNVLAKAEVILDAAAGPEARAAVSKALSALGEVEIAQVEQ